MRPRLFKSIALAAVVIMAAMILSRPRAWEATTLVTISSTPTLDARRVRFHRGNVGIDATVIRFDRSRVAARLVDVAEGQTLVDVVGDATLAINGGYFDAAFTPLGLYRIDGREVSPTLERPPLSGVVTIDAAGRLDLATRDDPSAPSAFQAGPFLIDPGGVVGIRADDGKLAERTIVALDDRWLCVIVTSPASLHAIANAIHERPDVLGISRVDRALNLDGGPSAGFVLRAGEVRSTLPRGRVRSAIRFDVR